LRADEDGTAATEGHGGPTATRPAVELRGITKRFGSILANDGIDLVVPAGEVRALVGENGAGKSTLMHILFGLIRPDAGEILIDGVQRRFSSPRQAVAAGLGMVHQHFMLFPSLTVAENVVFGAEPRRFGLVDRRRAEAEVRALGERWGLPVEPQRRVADLPVGLRQRVEILKALYRGADILILDEPTAVLTPGERRGLFRFVEEVAGAGKTVLFITHRLQEVLDLAQRATVLRDGRLVCTVSTTETTGAELSRLMVGREIVVARAEASTAGDPVLVVDGLRVRGRGGAEAVSGVSFELCSAEIVGVAGAAGNGQEELVEALVGLRRASAGRIRLSGRDVSATGIAGRRLDGLAYVPEDRDRTGLAPPASIAENLLMGEQRGQSDNGRRLRRWLSWPGWLRWSRVHAAARRCLARHAIRAPSTRLAVAHLSGGNRQRLVLARELERAGGLLVAEQPTRGVDIAAAEAIQDGLVEFRRRGGSVLLVSADLAELRQLSDRILVMFAGRCAGELVREEASEERLGLLMAGVADRGVPAES